MEFLVDMDMVHQDMWYRNESSKSDML